MSLSFTKLLWLVNVLITYQVTFRLVTVFIIYQVTFRLINVLIIYQVILVGKCPYHLRSYF